MEQVNKCRRINSIDTSTHVFRGTSQQKSLNKTFHRDDSVFVEPICIYVLIQITNQKIVY